MRVILAILLAASCASAQWKSLAAFTTATVSHRDPLFTESSVTPGARFVWPDERADVAWKAPALPFAHAVFVAGIAGATGPFIVEPVQLEGDGRWKLQLNTLGDPSLAGVSLWVQVITWHAGPVEGGIISLKIETVGA